MAGTMNAPVILDLGRTRRNRVRQLKKGRGKLLEDVKDALAEATEALGEQAEGQQLLPVILIYRRRRRKRNRGRGIVPFLL